MKKWTIAVIGTGNVGGALATGWAQAGHPILLGVRNTEQYKGKHLLQNPRTAVHPMREAVALADVIVIAATPEATPSIIRALGEVEGKVVIDTMNSVRTKPAGYDNTFVALQQLIPGVKLVKCFNTTGFENMANPKYGEESADMFMAGDDAEAKAVAKQLAYDLGFAQCFDFGGADKVALLEHFAMAWINLAIFQGMGRGIAFKVIHR